MQTDFIHTPSGPDTNLTLSNHVLILQSVFKKNSLIKIFQKPILRKWDCICLILSNPKLSNSTDPHTIFPFYLYLLHWSERLPNFYLFSLMALPIIFFPLYYTTVSLQEIVIFSCLMPENEKYQTVKFQESLPLKDNWISKHCIPTINIKFENIMFFSYETWLLQGRLTEFLVPVMYCNQITKASLPETSWKYIKTVFQKLWLCYVEMEFALYFF